MTDTVTDEPIEHLCGPDGELIEDSIDKSTLPEPHPSELLKTEDDGGLDGGCDPVDVCGDYIAGEICGLDDEGECLDGSCEGECTQTCEWDDPLPECIETDVTHDPACEEDGVLCDDPNPWCEPAECCVQDDWCEPEPPCDEPEDPPVVIEPVKDLANVDSLETVTFNILANDFISDGSAISVSAFGTDDSFVFDTPILVTGTNGATGYVTVEEDGDVFFDPTDFGELAPGEEDTFEILYEVMDAAGNTAEGCFEITLTGGLGLDF